MAATLLESIQTFFSRIFGQEDSATEMRRLESAIRHHDALKAAHKGDPDALDKVHNNDLPSIQKSTLSWMHKGVELSE